MQGAPGSQGSTGSQGPQGYQGTQGTQGVQGTQGFQGTQGNGYTVTSTTSQSIATGSLTWNTSNTGAYAVGQRVRVIYTTTPTNFVAGVITALTTNTSITVSVDTTGGSGGPYTSWTFAIDGITGNQGTQGFQGYQGVQGATGTQGNQGFQGTTGAQGTQGVQGATGSQGSTGSQGAQGSTGAQGTQGFQGNQGTQGSAGPQNYIQGAQVGNNPTTSGQHIIYNGTQWGIQSISGDATVSSAGVVQVTGVGHVTTGTLGVANGGTGTTTSTGSGSVVLSSGPSIINPTFPNGGGIGYPGQANFPAGTIGGGGNTTLTGAATASSQTVYLPVVSTSDTLVGRNTTDTLTNKTISGASNTITNVSLTTGVAGALPVANGGTGSYAPTAGAVVFGNGSGGYTDTSSNGGGATGAAGSLLMSYGAIANGGPEWVNFPIRQAATFALTSAAQVTYIVGQTLTITNATYASNVITFTYTTTGITPSVGYPITVMGMTPSGYNGTYVIASASSTQFTVYTASTLGTATGFGTAQIGDLVNDQPFAVDQLITQGGVFTYDGYTVNSASVGVDRALFQFQGSGIGSATQNGVWLVKQVGTTTSIVLSAMSWSNGTMTLNNPDGIFLTAGLAAGQYIIISGATTTGYNGTWQIATVTSTQITVTGVPTLTTPATGTMGTLTVPTVFCRDNDVDKPAKLSASLIQVQQGTTYGGTTWQVSLSPTGTLGVTSISIYQLLANKTAGSLLPTTISSTTSGTFTATANTIIPINGTAAITLPSAPPSGTIIGISQETNATSTVAAGGSDTLSGMGGTLYPHTGGWYIYNSATTTWNFIGNDGFINLGVNSLTGQLPTANGGTALSTFTAANNALYSTSASALTAGTLPTAAGGTGLTAVGTQGQALVVGPTGVLKYRSLAVGTPATATQANASLTAGSANIVSGSLFQLSTSDLAVGSRFRFLIGVAKTAAGTATWQVAVKYGTAGTTSDSAIATWTSGTNTAAIDSAILEITVNILTLGSSGTANCLAFYQNELTTATGLGSIAGTPGSTATLNTTSTNPYLHIDITPGSSAVMTAWCAAERLA